MSAKSPSSESKKRAKVLHHCDDAYIGRFRRKVIAKPENFMTLIAQRLDDEVRNAMTGEKPQRHQAVTVNSARSRA